MKKNNSFSIMNFILPSLRSILFILSGLLILIIPPFRGQNLAQLSVWWPLLCIGVNFLTIGILFILVKREGKKFSELFHLRPGNKRRAKDILIASAIMLVLGIGGLMGFSYLVYGYMPVTTSQPLPVWASIVVSVLLPATIIFSEIPFYLGYCAPRIKEQTGSEVFSIVYPLFFYALQHSFMPLLVDFRHILSRFIMFIPLLIMIGIWYSRKKELLPLMVGHGVLDVLTGIQLLMVAIFPVMYEMMQTQGQ